MNTTEAIAAIRDHIANGTDIDDATLKACAPLLATNVNARDAIIMCTLRPEDVSLDLALATMMCTRRRSVGISSRSMSTVTPSPATAPSLNP